MRFATEEERDDKVSAVILPSILLVSALLLFLAMGMGCIAVCISQEGALSCRLECFIV